MKRVAVLLFLLVAYHNSKAQVDRFRGIQVATGVGFSAVPERSDGGINFSIGYEMNFSEKGNIRLIPSFNYGMFSSLSEDVLDGN